MHMARSKAKTLQPQAVIERSRPRRDLESALEGLTEALQTDDRSAKTNVYLGDDVLMSYIPFFDTHFFLDSRDRGVTPHLCQGTVWEQGTTEAVRALVRPGQNVIDVGACVGWYTALFARAVGPTGRVLAVEANPRLAGLLARSVEEYRTVSVVNKAVGNEDKKTVFVSDDMTWAPGNTVGAAAGAGAVPVTYVRLDTLLQEGQWARARVDVIKIDVEGHEWQVWQGMQKTVAANPNLEVFLEINVRRDIINGIDPIEFYDDLQRKFENMFTINPDDGLLVHTSPSELLESTGNVLLYLSNQPLSGLDE
ncbi:hypothetical protein KFL_006540020 [Klebsormidium nitens]|uniref:Methyltransferase FkbM domain-containing protein n=1 Tax=Klebsormidium nitens TaxID=105231 RepID=A0A1Y1IQY3_KLENI|nr:hypothetical protein KFL_006540020 [Klebsormidium nitens]|eukprot:GAQ90548.1 hypothetical protein KFL_006540020 [Klebsormidium nitens]